MIVEDEYIVATDLRMIIQKAGYQVIGIVSSFDKALSMLTNGDEPTLVLLGIRLTGKSSGLSLADKLNEIRIPFIYVSASSNPDIMDRVRSTNPLDFVLKPFRAQDVLTAIGSAINKIENQKQQESKKIPKIAQELIYDGASDYNNCLCQDWSYSK